MVFLQLLLIGIAIGIFFFLLRALRDQIDRTDWSWIGRAYEAVTAIRDIPFKTYEQQRAEKNARHDETVKAAIAIAYHEGYKDGQASSEIKGRIDGWHEAMGDAMRIAREEVRREMEEKKTPQLSLELARRSL